MELILKIFFFLLSNTDIDFEVEKHTWKKYKATKVLSTINWIELIDKKEFA